MLSKIFLDRYKKKVKKKLKEKGLIHVFFKGLRRLISFEILIICPIVLVICLVIRVIKPIFFIRFGSLHGAKIGPFATLIELYLCKKEHGLQPKKSFDVFAPSVSSFLFFQSSYICNIQFLKMWKRLLRVSSVSKYFYIVMNTFSFGTNHIIKDTPRDVLGLLDKSSIHLSFTKEEIIQAKKDLLKMGIREKDKYVLLINRGERYTKEIFPHMDLTYNNFRNCDINDFLPAANNLTTQGNFVIRAGHLVSDLMKTDNPKIIEYDHKGFRTELLDIYLSANCRYIVNSDTGFTDIAEHNFRRPIVNVNFTQIEFMHSWSPKGLFTFRKYWLSSEKRFMRVKEMLQSGAGSFHTTEEYKKNGIEIVNNTPEEIKDTVEEMEKRLNKSWQDNDEDIELQRRFWSHFGSSNLHGVIRARIGAKFLRDNKDLI